ncbi:uncharacterized protein TNCV_3406151 [Trichonephila clavipes]|nr:uncharacterized protein TNCV_3406151 [Trichonephila clavipes]
MLYFKVEPESHRLGLFEKNRYPYDSTSFTTEEDYNHFGKDYSHGISTLDRIIEWKESQEPFPSSSHHVSPSFDSSHTTMSERLDRISETASNVIKSIKSKLGFSDVKAKPEKFINRFQTDEVGTSSQQLSSTDNDFIDRSKGKKKCIKYSGQLKKKYMNKGKLTDKRSSSSFDIEKNKKSLGIKRKNYQSNERKSAKVSKRQESDDPQAIKTPKRYSSLDSDDSSMLHKYLYGLPGDPEDVKIIRSRATVSKKQQTEGSDSSYSKDENKSIIVPGTEVSAYDTHHTKTETVEDSRKTVIRPYQQLKGSDENAQKETELALPDDYEKTSADNKKRKENTSESPKRKKAQIKPRKIEKEFPQKEISASSWQTYSSSKEGEKSPLQSSQTETIFGTKQSDVHRGKGKANLIGGKTKNKNGTQDSRKEPLKRIRKESVSSGTKVKESDKTVGKREIKTSAGKQIDLKQQGYESNQLKNGKKTKMSASTPTQKGKSFHIKKEPKVLLKEKNISLNGQRKVSNQKFTEKEKQDSVSFEEEQIDSEISSLVVDNPQADVKNKVPRERIKEKNQEKEKMPPEKPTDSGPKARDFNKLSPGFILADSKEVNNEIPNSFIEDLKEDVISRVPTQRKQAKETYEKHPGRQIDEEIKGSDSDESERKSKVTSSKQKTSEVLKAKEIGKKHPKRQLGKHVKSSDSDETATEANVTNSKRKTPDKLQEKVTKEKYPERKIGEEVEGSDSDEIANKIKAKIKKIPDSTQAKGIKEKYPERQIDEEAKKRQIDEEVKSSNFYETATQTKVRAFKEKTPDKTQAKKVEKKYPHRQIGEEAKSKNFDETATQTKDTITKKKTPDKLKAKEINEKYAKRRFGKEIKGSDMDEKATQTKVATSKSKILEKLQDIRKDSPPKISTKPNGQIEDLNKRDKLDELHNSETSHETQADRNILNTTSSDTKREKQAPSAKIYKSEDSALIDRAKKESDNDSQRFIDKGHELSFWRSGTPRYFQEDVRPILPKVTFFTNMTSVKTENPLKVCPLDKSSTVQQVAQKSFKESSKYKLMQDLAFYKFSEQQIRMKRKEKLQNEFLDYLERRKWEEQENGIVTDSPHLSERKVQSSPEKLKRNIKTKILNEDFFSVRKPLRSVQGIKVSSPPFQEPESKSQLSSVTISLNSKLSKVFKSAEKLKEEIRLKAKMNKYYFSSLKYSFSGVHIESDRTCSVVEDYSKEQESDDSCGNRIPSHLKIKRDLSESFFLFQKHRLKRADLASYEDTETVLSTACTKKGQFQPKVLSFFKEVYNERKKKLDEDFHRYVMHGKNIIEDENSQRCDSLSIKKSSSDSREFFKELYKERKRKLDKELIEYIENRENVTRSDKAVTFSKIPEKKDDLFGNKITEAVTKELKERDSEENFSSSPVLPTGGLTDIPIPVKISEKPLDIYLKDDTYPVDRMNDIAEKGTIQDSNNEDNKTIEPSTYKPSVGTYLQKEHYNRKTELDATKRKESFVKKNDIVKTEATDDSNKEHLGKTITANKFLQDSKQRDSINIMPDKERTSDSKQDSKLKTEIHETETYGKTEEINDGFEELEITDGFIRGTETKMVAASPTHKIFQEDIYEDLEEIAEETKFEEDDSDFLKVDIKDVMKINEKVDVKKPKEDFDRIKHSLTKNEKLMPSRVAEEHSRQILPQEVRKVTTDPDTFYEDKKPEPCSKTKDGTSFLRDEFFFPAPQSPDRSEINRERKCIYKIDGKKYLYFARISIPWDQKGRYSPSPKSVSTNDSTSSTIFPSRSSTIGSATDKRFEIFRVDNTCPADGVIDSSYLAEKITIQDSDKLIQSTDVSVIDHSNKFERGFGFSTASLISHITKEARGLEYVCTITEPLIKLSENVFISPTETSFGKRVLNVTPEIKDHPLQDPLLEDMKNQLIDGLHKLLGSTSPALCDLKQAEEQHYSEFYGVCSPDVKKEGARTQLESIMKTSTFDVSARENFLTTTRDFLFLWPTTVSIQDLEIEDENLEFVATNFHDIFREAIFQSADNFQYQVCTAPEQINAPAHLTEDSSEEKLFLFSLIKDSKPKNEPEFCPLFLSDAYYSTNSKGRWMHYSISFSDEKTDESSEDNSVLCGSENRQKYHILKKILPPPTSKTDIPYSSFESEDMAHKILLTDAYYGTGSKYVTNTPVSSDVDDVFIKAKKLVVSDQTSSPLDISKAKQKYHTVKKILPPSENVAFDMYFKNESQQKADNPHQIVLPDAYYGTSSESDFIPPAISLKVQQININAKKSKISRLYHGKQKYHTLKKMLPPPESEIAFVDPNFKENTHHNILHRISLPDAYYGAGSEPRLSFIESSDDDLRRKKLEAMEKVTATPSPFEGRQKFHTLKKTLPPSSYSKFIAIDINSPLQYNDISIPDAYFGTGSDFPLVLLDSEKDPVSDKARELDVSRRVNVVVTKWKEEQKYRTLIKTLPPLVQKPSITATDMDLKNIPLERSFNFTLDSKLSTLDATDYIPPCQSKVLELKRNDNINIHTTQDKFEQPEVPQLEGLDFDQDIADILDQLCSLFWESSDQSRDSDQRTTILKMLPTEIIMSEDLMTLLNSLSDGARGAAVRNRNENNKLVPIIDPSFQNRVWDLTNVSQNFSVRVQAINMDPLILKISHPSNPNTTVEMNLVEFLRYRSLQSIENRANEQLSVGVINWQTPDEIVTPARPYHDDIILRPHFTEDETKKVVDTEVFLRNFKGLEDSSLRNTKHKEYLKKRDSHLNQRIKGKVLDLDTLSLLPQGINVKALLEMQDIDIEPNQTKTSALEEWDYSKTQKTQSESFKPEDVVTVSGSAEHEEAPWLVITTKINVQTSSSSSDGASEYEEEEDTQNEDIQPREIHLGLAVERAADDSTGEVPRDVQDTSFPVPSTSFAEEHDIQDAKIPPHHRKLSLSRILSVINDEIHRIENFYASRPRLRRVKSERKKLKMERKAEKAIFIKDSIQDETIVTAKSDSEESD